MHACPERATQAPEAYLRTVVMSRNVFKLLREFWREVQGFGAPVSTVLFQAAGCLA